MSKPIEKDREHFNFDEDHALSIAAHAQRYKNGVITQDSLYQEIKNRIARIRAEAKAEALMAAVNRVHGIKLKWRKNDTARIKDYKQAANESLDHAIAAIIDEEFRTIHKKWDVLDKCIGKLIAQNDGISPETERESRRRLAIYVELSCELLAITQKLDSLQTHLVQSLLRAGELAAVSQSERIS